MNFEVPETLYGNLEQGEKLVNGVKNVKFNGSKPEYFFLSDRRVIFFNEKRFRRFDLSTIPYSKIFEIKAQTGALRYGSVEIVNEDEVVFKVVRIPNAHIESFVKALEKSLNMIAIEPISIFYVKSLIRKAWRFQKPAEIIYKTGRAESEAQSTPSNQTQTDPLKTLQLRFVSGEITREEYLKMKKILET